jgi:hypothetical protein
MDERPVAHPVPASDLDARGPRGYQVAHRVVRSFVDYAGIFGAWLLSAAGFTVDASARATQSGTCHTAAQFALPGVGPALRVAVRFLSATVKADLSRESGPPAPREAWKARRQSGRQNCCMWPPLLPNPERTIAPGTGLSSIIAHVVTICSAAVQLPRAGTDGQIRPYRAYRAPEPAARNGP